MEINLLQQYPTQNRSLFYCMFYRCLNSPRCGNRLNLFIPLLQQELYILGKNVAPYNVKYGSRAMCCFNKTSIRHKTRIGDSILILQNISGVVMHRAKNPTRNATTKSNLYKKIPLHMHT